MKRIAVFPILLLAACSSLLSTNSNTNQSQKSNSVSQVQKTPKAIEKNKSETKAVNNSTYAYAPYVIQPGDVLNISVWKEKDLQKEALVRPDGFLTFPLVGDIRVAGLTFKQFQKTFTARLARYVPKPSVTISYTQPQGNKIYVIGKVNRPGEYINNRHLDIMQALSLAGGLNSFARGGDIQILRRENGKLRAISFNYNKVKKGKKLDQNIMLESGDVVVVR